MRVAVLLCLALAARALLASSGALAYAAYPGGDGADIIHAIAIDASNNVYLTGETLSSNFPVTAGAFQKKHAGQPGTFTGLMAPIAVAPDALVVKLNPAGQIVYATYLGGAGADAGLGIAVRGGRADDGAHPAARWPVVHRGPARKSAAGFLDATPAHVFEQMGCRLRGRKRQPYWLPECAGGRHAGSPARLE
jgi:hypothetical protein